MSREIKTTRNYEQFTLLDGNRKINHLKVEKLKKSMMNNYVPAPIIVNNKNEIIDGQHRFEAIKSLNLALYYCSIGRIGIEETRVLNMNGVPWKNKEHLHSYMTKEKKEYPDYYQGRPYHQFHYIQTAYKIHFQVIMTLIHDSPYLSRHGELFKEGKLRIHNFAKLENDAKFINSMKDYHKKWRNRFFQNAMSTIMSQSEFSRERWMRKMSMRHAKLLRNTTKTDYINNMEEVYNWQERVKVTFNRQING